MADARPRTPAQQAKALRESLRLASELADALTGQAERVRRRCQELEQTLADLPELAAALAAPAPGELPHVAEVGPPARGHPDESPARLAAMEMAVQGASREDIEAYLRDSLGVEKVDEILDQVLRSRA